MRGIHSVRTGLQFDGGNYRSDDSSNYLGTYTFESLEAYLAGTPRSFTQRVGDPNIAYKNLQGGVYVQDDIRVRKNLTLSPGVRYELQTHLSDVQQLRPAVRHHLVAGQERQDDAARQRRHLLRLAVDRHLRADAARRRLPPARAERHQSVLPDRRPLADGTGAADQPLSAGRRSARCSATPASAPASTAALTKVIRVNATYAHTQRRPPDARPEPEPADRRRSAPTRPSPTSSRSWTTRASRQHTLNIGATINFNVRRRPGRR